VYNVHILDNDWHIINNCIAVDIHSCSTVLQLLLCMHCCLCIYLLERGLLYCSGSY